MLLVTAVVRRVEERGALHGVGHVEGLAARVDGDSGHVEKQHELQRRAPIEIGAHERAARSHRICPE